MTLRVGRWLAVFLVGALSALAPAIAAEQSPTPPPFQALILYDSMPPYIWVGELQAMQIANLLGHFPINYTIEPVESYAAGQMEQYSVTFYLGVAYDGSPPTAFLDDVMTTERTVCWFRYNLEQIAWDSGNDWNPAFTDRYGFQFAGVDGSGYPQVQYKSETLTRDQSDPDLGGTVILDPDLAEVKAIAYQPATDTEPEASWPYVLHSGNLWYFADSPFGYVSEEDRYLIFCDLIHDIVGIDHASTHRALIRIEDVSTYSLPQDLTAVADYLWSESVPFEMATIPVFRDPLGVLTGHPQENFLSQSQSIVYAISYMLERGGQIIAHGYTHQYDSIPNPHDGLTGDDCEFILASWNSTHDYIELIGPVPEDSVAWVNDRVDLALAELTAAGFTPIAWETPHYLASALDSTEFGKRFTLCAGRGLYFSSSGDEFVGQFFPYLIEQDFYGQKILPENLGYVMPTPSDNSPAYLPADIVRAARKNLVVRDGWASAYFHPYLDIGYLEEVIQGVKSLGYSYVAAPTVLAEAGPDKTLIEGESAVIVGSASNGSTPYHYSWSPSTGLSDPTVSNPVASPSSTTLYTLTVTDDEGASDNDTVSIIVVPRLVVEAGTDTTIALGNTLTLEGSASGGQPPYSYSWWPTTGLNDPNIAQPTASPDTTTTYTLTVTDLSDQTNTETVTVTIAPELVAEAGPAKVIITGNSATLDGFASGGLTPYSYSWSPATDLNDPAAARPTASPFATTIYTLTVTDGLGQSDTDVVTVIVTSVLMAEAGPNKTIIGGDSTMLVGSASGGMEPFTYYWSPGIGLDNPSLAHPNASSTSTTTYTLTVTDSLTQTDTDTVTVTVISFADIFSDQWAFHEIAACVVSGIVAGYDDGLYHPEFKVTRDQMAVYIARGISDGDANVPDPDCSTPPFTDVNCDHWARKYIQYAVSQGVVQGYPEGDYRPGVEVTRDQMAVYVARSMIAPSGEAGLADYVPANPRDFPDVMSDFWAWKHIEYCVQYGVVNGYDDGLYHPEWIVTRDQMAVYIARAFKLPV